MDEAGTHSVDAKTLRETLNWTQEQMADYLGVDRSAVSRLENGRTAGRGPIRKLLRQLADSHALSDARAPAEAVA